jgi:hypothetical protein
MAGPAVEFQALGMIQQWKENDIEIGDASKQSAPEDGAVTDFIAESSLTDSGAQCGLSDGIHLVKRVIVVLGEDLMFFRIHPKASG